MGNHRKLRPHRRGCELQRSRAARALQLGKRHLGGIAAGRAPRGRQDRPKAFPTFAAFATNANEARAWGAGFNWYLSRAVRLSQDFLQTRFSTNGRLPTTQILLHNETALITRVQLSF